MSLKLVLSQVPGVRFELEQDRMGHAYELVDYWEHHPRYTATLKYMGKDHHIEYTFAPQSFLNYVVGSEMPKGEKFGAYVGAMIFVNAELQKTHPNWIPYVVTKLWADKLIDPGLDTTGRVKHYQSLFGTIRLAGMLMSHAELEDFISAIKDHDTSGYFELDREVRDFLASTNGNSLEARRRYLENHRMSQWVIRGREEEMLAQMGFQDIAFRNHAEAVTRSIANLGPDYLYAAVPLVRELRSVDPNVPILIRPPYNAIAYMMTLEGNGIVDLVRFHPVGTNPIPEEIITVIKGKNRTLSGIGIRLSYIMHRAEEKVQEQIVAQCKNLDGLVIEAEDNVRRLQQQIAEIAASIDPNRPDAGQALARLSEFPVAQNRIQIQIIQSLANQTDQAISGLEELAEQLKSRI